MIKTLIFDFGDVFINLDKAGTIKRSKELLGKDIMIKTKNKNDLAIFRTNNNYEKGLISTSDFTTFYTNLLDKVSDTEFKNLWNSLIKDFPLHRLKFIKALAQNKKYNLILLSNTNELHINHIKKNILFYEEFKSCFNAFYLSHEIHLRKPDKTIFDFVLNKHNLKASESLFIDDTKENTDTANAMGIHVWNIDETKDDVVNLFNVKKELF